MAAANPWNNSDLMAGFKLGDPDSVLVLAKQHELDGGGSMEVGSTKYLAYSYRSYIIIVVFNRKPFLFQTNNDIEGSSRVTRSAERGIEPCRYMI